MSTHTKLADAITTAANALGTAPSRVVPCRPQPLFDLDIREKAILATIVVAVFSLGLFPAEPLRKTELAARDFQQRVAAERTGTPVAARDKPDLAVSRVALPGSGAAKTGDIR